ncbi:KH domain-containing protein [Candidatus Dojkabacteria bacterium]|nr:KH domain-containing protein [Candidatus Dojkabacteria bacterium]
MDDKSAIAKTKETAKEILDRLEVRGEIDVHMQEGDEDRKYLAVKIIGEDLGNLIGHHGKILEGIQTILGLIIGRESEGQYRVILDINDYREKREEYLVSMALQAVDQVRESGQDLELEPMKPNERRIVHMTLQKEKGIATESIGEGEDRRIIIKKED